MCCDACVELCCVVLRLCVCVCVCVGVWVCVCVCVCVCVYVMCFVLSLSESSAKLWDLVNSIKESKSYCLPTKDSPPHEEKEVSSLFSLFLSPLLSLSPLSLFSRSLPPQAQKTDTSQTLLNKKILFLFFRLSGLAHARWHEFAPGPGARDSR